MWTRASKNQKRVQKFAKMYNKLLCVAYHRHWHNCFLQRMYPMNEMLLKYCKWCLYCTTISNHRNKHRITYSGIEKQQCLKTFTNNIYFFIQIILFSSSSPIIWHELMLYVKYNWNISQTSASFLLSRCNDQRALHAKFLDASIQAILSYCFTCF